MVNQYFFTVSFKCKKCKFVTVLHGTKDTLKNITKHLIDNHSKYSTKCKSSNQSDFIVEKKDKSNFRVEELITKRREETVQILERENLHVNDIIGAINAKNVLENRIKDYMIYKDRLKDDKRRKGGGVILAGIQGTAKTDLMVATVNDIVYSNPEYRRKYDIIIMKSHDFGGTLGQIAKTFESLLEIIRKENRDTGMETILLIDEIDVLLPKRNTDRLTSKEKMNSVLDEFGGIHDDHTLFVLGTTNRPQDIDSEALVSRRFGSPVLVNIPTDDERWEIFEKFTKSIKMDDRIDSDYINEKLNKFTGRDIDDFVTDLHIIYYKKEPKLIDCDDIENLIKTKYKITNKANLERINELASFYSRYDEKVEGSEENNEERKTVTVKTEKMSINELKTILKNDDMKGLKNMI